MESNDTQALLVKIDEQQRKIDAIFVSVEKTRKYFKWTLIISTVVVILPLLGLLVAIPAFLKTLQIPSELGL